MKHESKNRAPQHIAFIIDGNRRWAKKRGLPSFRGHEKGYENVKTIFRACRKRGIPVVTFWVLSTENLKRSKTEVQYLFFLLQRAIDDFSDELAREKVKLLVSGKMALLPKRLVSALRDVGEKTKNFKKGILHIALAYGGRQELIDACETLRRDPEAPKKLNEQSFRKYLYHGELPDPDLIVRTGGELRLSGFLPWQAAYAELAFTRIFWPDFSEQKLNKILADYARRERRFGR